MDKKKVADLARSCSLSCKKLVEDKQLQRKLPTPSVIVVSLAILNLVTISPNKDWWSCI
jgi:hypothetical protein